MLRCLPAAAAGEVAVIAIADTINSLDIQRAGTNRPAYEVAINAYDRLLSFGTRTLPGGVVVSDYHTLKGELAESWQVAGDGQSILFKLRPDATFHDGAPVTAEDVKWSFDRAVSIGGFATGQFAAGRMTRPEQFEVVDAHNFRLHLARSSKLTLPDLATPIAIIYNAKLVKQHVTAADPWGAEFTHRNDAGSGGFKVERWDPGQQLVYSRNDSWKCGPVPKLRRVIVREVPSQSTRRALIERGDIQIDFDITGRDADEMDKAKKAHVVSGPIANTEIVLAPNLIFEPFRDKKVRQALAWAIPYEQIFQQAAFGLGVRMWGGKPGAPAGIAWPQPAPYTTDVDRAKALLAATAYKDGFEVPLSIDLSTADWSEPTALLIQEGLAKIGVKTTINRVPGANWRTVALAQKKLPLIIDGFGGWLDTPDYYFYWCYGRDRLFNASNWSSPELEALIDKATDMAEDDPNYQPTIARMIAIAFDEMPRIPLWQPALDSALVPAVQGYQTWFHRGPDARPLSLA